MGSTSAPIEVRRSDTARHSARVAASRARLGQAHGARQRARQRSGRAAGGPGYDPGHDLPLEPETPELLQAVEEGEREFPLQLGRLVRRLREPPELFVLPLRHPRQDVRRRAAIARGPAAESAQCEPTAAADGDAHQEGRDPPRVPVSPHRPQVLGTRVVVSHRRWWCSS